MKNYFYKAIVTYDNKEKVYFSGVITIDAINKAIEKIERKILKEVENAEYVDGIFIENINRL